MLGSRGFSPEIAERIATRDPALAERIATTPGARAVRLYRGIRTTELDPTYRPEGLDDSWYFATRPRSLVPGVAQPIKYARGADLRGLLIEAEIPSFLTFKTGPGVRAVAYNEVSDHSLFMTRTAQIDHRPGSPNNPGLFSPIRWRDYVPPATSKPTTPRRPDADP